MGLRPESVGGIYPLTPVLIGSGWYILNCHTGKYAGRSSMGKEYPRCWDSVAEALDWVSLMLSNERTSVSSLIWVEYPEVGPKAAKPPKTWAAQKYPTWESKVQAVADACGFVGFPDTVSDKYRLIREVENLLAGR